MFTNLRVGHHELDVVARDGETIVVVEVRTRGGRSWQTAIESVTPAKARAVRQAGEQLWRERFERDASAERMRFDLAAVTIDEQGATSIEYLRAAL